MLVVIRVHLISLEHRNCILYHLEMRIGTQWTDTNNKVNRIIGIDFAVDF